MAKRCDSWLVNWRRNDEREMPIAINVPRIVRKGKGGKPQMPLTEHQEKRYRMINLRRDKIEVER